MPSFPESGVLALISAACVRGGAGLVMVGRTRGRKERGPSSGAGTGITENLSERRGEDTNGGKETTRRIPAFLYDYFPP